MAEGEKWQRARLFPVTGIGNPNEQERRGCSVLLAVVSSVKEFGRALTTRCGAPAGPIETFIEVPLELGGKTYRPDGLIRVTRGQRTWTALVETKTGRNELDADQVTTYLDIARDEGYDAVITISHQVASTPGVHPLRSTGARPARWTSTTCRGAGSTPRRSSSTPTTRWQTPTRPGCSPSSSATSRTPSLGRSTSRTWVLRGWRCEMGPRTRRLRANDPEALAVVARFDQLLAFCGMELSRHLGVHVSQRLSKAELDDQATRLQAQAAGLAKNGQLAGALIVPNAAVPIEVTVDLRANRVYARATIAAPTDRRASARATWLLNQLKTAPPTLQVVAGVARVKTPGRSHALSELIADPKLIAETPHVDIRSFTLTASQSAGTKRGQGKGSFVSSVTSLVDSFYAGVVQPLKPWVPPAPKPKAPAPPSDDGPSSVLSNTVDASQVVEGAPAPAITARPELTAAPARQASSAAD